MQQYSDEQLLRHLEGLGHWTGIRALELKHFLGHLAVQLEQAGTDPNRVASLLYGLQTYVSGVQEMVDRCRKAEAELTRRLADRAGVSPSSST